MRDYVAPVCNSQSGFHLATSSICLGSEDKSIRRRNRPTSRFVFVCNFRLKALFRLEWGGNNFHIGFETLLYSV